MSTKTRRYSGAGNAVSQYKDAVRLRRAFMPTLRILVVDDDAGVAWTIEEMLRGFAKTYVATSARQARDMLRVFEYDIVITDYNLGDGSGLDLIREIKNATPRTRAILISAQAQKDDVAEAARRGADYYLDKPFVQEALREAIARVLERALLDAKDLESRVSDAKREAMRDLVSWLSQFPRKPPKK